MGNPVSVLVLLLTVKLGYSYFFPNPPDKWPINDFCPKDSVFATNGKDGMCVWCDPYCKDRNSEDCRKICPEYMEDKSHRKNVIFTGLLGIVIWGLVSLFVIVTVKIAPNNDPDNHDVGPTAPSVPSNRSELEGGTSTTETDQDERRSSVSSGESDEVELLTLNSPLPGPKTDGGKPLRHPAENDDGSNFNVQERGGHRPGTYMSGVPSSAAISL